MTTLGNFPSATSIATTDYIPVEQGGVLKKATPSLIPFVPSGTGAVTTDLQTRGRLVVYAQDFGATANGTTDDAAALEKAVLAVYTAGGGTVYLPAGTYLLGTLSGDANAHSAYICARDRVSIVGAGRGASVLKVKSGENARFIASNAPNIIGTQQSGPLTDCRFADFTVDWNGANNLLSGGYTARNNAAIIATNGGRRVTVQRVLVKETPGNQCVFFSNSAYATVPGGDILVHNCQFLDNGSGLSGNTNADHSSIYIVGDNCAVVDCSMTASQAVNGTPYELHGAGNTGRGNNSKYYSRGFYLATDLANVDGMVVDGDTHKLLQTNAFDISAPTYTLDNARVLNSVFELDTAVSSFSVVTYFIGGSTGLVKSLRISGCKFIGNNAVKNRCMLFNNIHRLIFERNVVENFNDTTDGYGIISGNTDIGSSLAAEELIVIGNLFKNVYRPININAATLGISWVEIENNTFIQSGASAGATILLALLTGKGWVRNNNIDTANYAAPFQNISGGNTINGELILTGSATYDPGSLNDGAGTTTTVGVTGAALGDYAEAAFSLDLQGITVTAWVSSTNNVSVRFQNESGGVLDLASGTLRARVKKTP